jgi:predicted nucleic acid-binding protein
MGEGDRTKKDVRIRLVDAFEDSKHFIAISPFLISEISTHLADWYLLNKVVKSGYSYRRFASERKNYNLSDAEKNNIDSIIGELSSKDFVDIVTIEEIKKPDLDILFLLIGNQVGFYDAIHVMVAKGIGCDYFVTADSELRIRTQQLINDNTIDGLKIASPSGFLKVLDAEQ